MRLYELVLITRPALSDADRKKLIESIKDSLKDMKITKDEDQGQKPLAYRIKKEIAGVFHTIHMETEKTIPAEFERSLMHNENVIRHLLIRTK